MDQHSASYARSSPDRRALLAQLLHQLGSEFDAFPLSFAQQRLWFLDQLDPGSPLYNLPAAVGLSGPLDLAGMRGSLAAIVDRHETLRTTIATVAGRPMQLIAASGRGAADLPMLDLRALPAGVREATAERLACASAQRPLDLARGPLLRANLLRLADREHLLLLTIHHIVADGWSIGVFVRDLAALYAAATIGRPADLPDLPIQYADYAAWQREWLASAGDADQPAPLQTQLAYWRGQLAGAPDLLDLPTDRPRPHIQSSRGATLRFVLPQDLSDALDALGRRVRATLFMTLLAAFDVALARYSGQADLLVGTPIANRTRGETENLIGLFVNTLVLRADLSGDPPFETFLARVRATCLDAYAHQDLPFERLVEALRPARDLRRAPLAQVVFALQNAPQPPLDLAGLRLRLLDVDSGTAKFDLTLSMEQGSGGLRGWFEYSTDLFDESTIARLAGHFQTLLAGVAATPRTRLADLPLLTSAERAQALLRWNPPAVPHDQPVTPLIQRIAAQAAATPDAVAASLADQAITYAALLARAHALAHALRQRGGGPETLVALAADRALAMVVGLLGVLAAGSAYVPIDPAYPSERIRFMLHDSGAAVCLTLVDDPTAAAVLHAACAQTPTTLLDLRADWPAIRAAAPPTPAPLPLIHPDQRAYVIYTSGSTGTPKGVMVTQRGLASLVAGLQRFFADPQVQVAGLITSISFDISVNQIFPTLATGRALEIIPEALKFNSPALLRRLWLRGVQLLDAVPSLLQALLRDLAPARPPHALRYLLIGGEQLEPSLLQAIFGQLGDQVRVVNIYGLTELSDVNACAVIDARGAAAPVTIGDPLPGNQLYLLNARLALQPVGVAGELCIAGAQLARGYLGRPDLTAARFVPNPFVQGSGIRDQGPGARGQGSGVWGLGADPEPRTPNPEPRLCRTGDLGRWRADGRIELLGRIDAQVKLRGYRIELGEIEAALGAMPGVRACVAVARADARGEPQLVAYIVPAAPAQDEGGPADVHRSAIGDAPLSPFVLRPSSLAAELRDFLKHRLPAYMLPAAFVLLDALPTTPNGKIDRRALPAPDFSSAERTAAYVAPRTPVEAVLARMWAQVLRVERVGVHDNFFELGGHSLLATQLAASLRTTFQVELPLRSLFEATTVADMARSIIAHEPRPGQSERIARVLQRLETMSAEEARALLEEKERPAIIAED